jgi:hypothetical protein
LDTRRRIALGLLENKCAFTDSITESTRPREFETVQAGELILGFQEPNLQAAVDNFGPSRAHQSRSMAALSALVTSLRSSAGRVPIFSGEFRAVQRGDLMALDNARPRQTRSAPRHSYNVGPRLARNRELDTGTTMIDIEAGVWLKPSRDTTTTGQDAFPFVRDLATITRAGNAKDDSPP